jgi:hypothetical protein
MMPADMSTSGSSTWPGSSSLLEEAEVALGAVKLREALALWTGDALADLDDMPSPSGEGQARGAAGSAMSAPWAELDLDDLPGGRDGSSCGFENPYRERAWCR